jgi:hypothetical protein
VLAGAFDENDGMRRLHGTPGGDGAGR